MSVATVQSKSGAGRLWTNKWAAQRAGRATKPIRATLFFTLIISASRAESQTERTRSKRPLGYGWPPGAAPGCPDRAAILTPGRDFLPLAEGLRQAHHLPISALTPPLPLRYPYVTPTLPTRISRCAWLVTRRRHASSPEANRAAAGRQNRHGFASRPGVPHPNPRYRPDIRHACGPTSIATPGGAIQSGFSSKKQSRPVSY